MLEEDLDAKANIKEGKKEEPRPTPKSNAQHKPTKRKSSPTFPLDINELINKIHSALTILSQEELITILRNYCLLDNTLLPEKIDSKARELLSSIKTTRQVFITYFTEQFGDCLTLHDMYFLHALFALNIDTINYYLHTPSYSPEKFLTVGGYNLIHICALLGDIKLAHILLNPELPSWWEIPETDETDGKTTLVNLASSQTSKQKPEFYSPLHIALTTAYQMNYSALATEFTILLISAGADVNVPDWNGRTPMHYVATNNTIDPLATAIALWEANAQLGAVDNYTETPADKITNFLFDPLKEHNRKLLFFFFEFVNNLAPDTRKLLGNPCATNDQGQTILHYILQLSLSTGQSKLFLDYYHALIFHNRFSCMQDADSDLIIADFFKTKDYSGKTVWNYFEQTNNNKDFQPASINLDIIMQLLIAGIRVKVSELITFIKDEQITGFLASVITTSKHSKFKSSQDPKATLEYLIEAIKDDNSFDVLRYLQTDIIQIARQQNLLAIDQLLFIASQTESKPNNLFITHLLVLGGCNINYVDMCSKPPLDCATTIQHKNLLQRFGAQSAQTDRAEIARQYVSKRLTEIRDELTKNTLEKDKTPPKEKKSILSFLPFKSANKNVSINNPLGNPSTLLDAVIKNHKPPRTLKKILDAILPKTLNTPTETQTLIQALRSLEKQEAEICAGNINIASLNLPSRTATATSTPSVRALDRSSSSYQLTNNPSPG